jgi:hypothetical protein
METIFRKQQPQPKYHLEVDLSAVVTEDWPVLRLRTVYPASGPESKEFSKTSSPWTISGLDDPTLPYVAEQTFESITIDILLPAEARRFDELVVLTDRIQKAAKVLKKVKFKELNIEVFLIMSATQERHVTRFKVLGEHYHVPDSSHVLERVVFSPWGRHNFMVVDFVLTPLVDLSANAETTKVKLSRPVNTTAHQSNMVQNTIFFLEKANTSQIAAFLLRQKLELIKIVANLELMSSRLALLEKQYDWLW